MREHDKYDWKCISCVLTQEHFDLYIDCTTCKHYYEKIEKGEIFEVENNEDIEEE